MQSGRGDAPLWTKVLVAAETWGTPPWMLVEQPGSARWLARLGTLQEIRAFVSSPTGTAEPFEDI